MILSQSQGELLTLNGKNITENKNQNQYMRWGVNMRMCKVKYVNAAMVENTSICTSKELSPQRNVRLLQLRFVTKINLEKCVPSKFRCISLENQGMPWRVVLDYYFF